MRFAHVLGPTGSSESSMKERCIPELQDRRARVGPLPPSIAGRGAVSEEKRASPKGVVVSEPRWTRSASDSK